MSMAGSVAGIIATLIIATSITAGGAMGLRMGTQDSPGMVAKVVMAASPGMAASPDMVVAASAGMAAAEATGKTCNGWRGQHERRQSSR